MTDYNATVSFDRKPEVEDGEKTVVGVYRPEHVTDDLAVTILDGQAIPVTYRLADFHKSKITFGRAHSDGSSAADIVLSSAFVSREHGSFTRIAGGWRLDDTGSRNGLFCNNAPMKSKVLQEGDIIRIDDPTKRLPDGVLMIVTSFSEKSKWQIYMLGEQEITIGRSESNSIVLPHVGVSKQHAMILRRGDAHMIADNHSTNGVFVNGEQIVGTHTLREKDVITITSTKMIYTSGFLYYYTSYNGISVETNDIVIRRKRGRSRMVTCDHTTLKVNPGELVSIIGGSGAGKSTLLNAMSGYLRPSEGKVFVNGIDLYQNFDAVKKVIGYVPQQDIVYDTLTLYDTLAYTAKLRLPSDTSSEEREAAIRRAIEMVELQEKRDAFVKDLSGGQKKRASIAVELLSDPNLLFLDEPCSGLDPGTEQSLMRTLRRLADQGKTIILVTHSTLQLHLCDKIAFMGRGGKLCYFGPYQDALAFFGVTDVVDCYNKMNNESAYWKEHFDSLREDAETMDHQQGRMKQMKTRFSLGGLSVLIERYLKLTWNDKGRLAILILLVPTVVVLISLVKNGDQFKAEGGLNITRNILFVLSCSSFFLGMFGSISEISKERTIVRREYMTGLSLTSYTLSKLFVLGLICLVQSVLITVLFALLVGVPKPDSNILFAPILEIGLTTFLLEFASSDTGILVSAIVPKPDLGVTITVILLMPQILFSGLTFELEGMTEKISWFTLCRWGMEGYGSICDLNQMTHRLVVNGQEFLQSNAKDMFEPTARHLVTVWGILFLYVVVCGIATRIVLQRMNKE